MAAPVADWSKRRHAALTKTPERAPIADVSSEHAHLIDRQQRIGNQAVNALLSPDGSGQTAGIEDRRAGARAALVTPLSGVGGNWATPGLAGFGSGRPGLTALPPEQAAADPGQALARELLARWVDIGHSTSLDPHPAGLPGGLEGHVPDTATIAGLLGSREARAANWLADRFDEAIDAAIEDTQPSTLGTAYTQGVVREFASTAVRMIFGMLTSQQNPSGAAVDFLLSTVQSIRQRIAEGESFWEAVNSTLNPAVRVACEAWLSEEIAGKALVAKEAGDWNLAVQRARESGRSGARAMVAAGETIMLARGLAGAGMAIRKGIAAKRGAKPVEAPATPQADRPAPVEPSPAQPTAATQRPSRPMKKPLLKRIGTAVRARALAYGMKGVVEAAPITGGTGASPFTRPQAPIEMVAPPVESRMAPTAAKRPTKAPSVHAPEGTPTKTAGGPSVPDHRSGPAMRPAEGAGVGPVTSAKVAPVPSAAGKQVETPSTSEAVHGKKAALPSVAATQSQAQPAELASDLSPAPEVAPVVAPPVAETISASSVTAPSTGPSLPTVAEDLSSLAVREYRPSQRERNRPIERHEVLQHSFLAALGKVTGKRGVGYSGFNTVIELPVELHKKVNRLQDEAGLHDPEKLSQMSAMEVIEANLEAMEKAGIPPEIIARIWEDVAEMLPGLGPRAFESAPVTKDNLPKSGPKKK